MDQINRSIIEKEKFQLFCNALLSFEIGKKFEPFSAAGKDKGIDGRFEGTYDGRSGKWRFQDKYHEGTRSAVLSRLKADIKEQVLKITNEDYLVLLTNFELLPQQLDDLKNIGYNSLPKDLKKPAIEIWDGAKLNTLYIKYPILRMWLDEGFTTAQLVKYKNHFEKALDSGLDKPFTLSNELIHREAENQLLQDFIFAEDKKMVLVSGEAGIGKTRLVVEFFKQNVDTRDDWEALVLQNHQIDFDRLSFALKGEINYIVLIEDAHTYSVQAIMDISKLAIPAGKKKIKFILTASSIAWNDSFKLLSAYIVEEIAFIQLEIFSKAKTFDFFSKQLEEGPYSSFISTLVEISNGRPILIVALLRAMYLRMPVSDIKKESFFSNYVLNNFNLFINKLKNATNLPTLKLENSIRLICLIEPFDYNSESIRKALTQILSIDEDQLDYILQELLNDGLAIGKYLFNIKPDYYSDVFLKLASEKWIEDKVEKLPKFISNIIRNLNSTDEVYENDKKSASILDIILVNYINKIDGMTDATEMTPIGNTIDSIAYFKPKMASLFLDKVLYKITDSKSPTQSDVIKHKDHYNSVPFGIFATIKHILFDLLYHKEFYSYVFDTCLLFYRIMNDKAIFKTTWDYSWKERFEHYELTKQKFFIEKAVSILKSGDLNDVLYFVECFSELLKLEFRGTTSTGIDGRAMTITTYFIPPFESVKRSRRMIIDELIRLHRLGVGEDNQQKILYQILDVPRNILSTQKNTMPYEGNEEIKGVLQFLIDTAPSLSPEEKKMVFTHLHRFRSWRIQDEFKGMLDQIEKLLIPATLPEQLNDIILRAELSRSNDQDMISLGVKNAFRNLIETNSAAELSAGISKILAPGIQPNYYFWPFLDELVTDFVDKTKAFYEIIYKDRKDLVYNFGSSILRPLYIRKGEVDFYWYSITLLEEDGSEEARNVIFHIYSFNLEPDFVPGQKDLDLLSRTYENRSVNNDLLVGQSLITVLKADAVLFDKFADDYLSNCSPKAASRFFLNLFREDEKYFDRAASLFLKLTIRFNIEYEFEQCLVQIISKRGFSPVFDYFLERYAYLLHLMDTKDTFYGYNWVPTSLYSSFLKTFDDRLKIEMYSQALKWFISEDFKEANAYFGKQLLNFFLPSIELTKELDTLYRGFLDSKLTNGMLALRLADSLSLFEGKNERLIELVIDYWKQGNLCLSNDPSTLASFNTACSIAIWHVGHKMGTPGEPFQEDLHLKGLLLDAMDRHRSDAGTPVLLETVLQFVNKAISRDSAGGEKEW